MSSAPAEPLYDGRPCRFCGVPQRTPVAPPAVCGGWFAYASAPEPGIPEAWRTPTAHGRYAAIVPLCAHHERLLRAAGARGLRHGPSGVRWWIAAG